MEVSLIKCFPFIIFGQNYLHGGEAQGFALLLS